jgi:hypothetical protein
MSMMRQRRMWQWMELPINLTHENWTLNLITRRWVYDENVIMVIYLHSIFPLFMLDVNN